MRTTFGVEIEMNTRHSDSQVAARLHAAGINCTTSRRLENPAGRWAVKHDGSIQGGWEIVSPILEGEDGLRQTLTVCRALQGIPDADARQDCGLHVHVGGFEDDAERLRAALNVSRRFVNFEDSMDALHPEHRRGNRNTYCRSNYRQFGATLAPATEVMWQRLEEAAARRTFAPSGALESVVQVATPERYMKLNLQSMLRHGTVEYRQHAGSIDGQEITNWIRFVIAFTETAVKTERLRRRSPRQPREDRFRKMLRGVDMVTAANMWRRRAVLAMTPELEAQMRREIAEGVADYRFDGETGLFRRFPITETPQAIAA